MKIRINDKIYNPDIEPILFIFDDANEKEAYIKYISSMHDDAFKLLIYPTHVDEKDARKIIGYK